MLEVYKAGDGISWGLGTFDTSTTPPADRWTRPAVYTGIATG